MTVLLVGESTCLLVPGRSGRFLTGAVPATDSRNDFLVKRSYKVVYSVRGLERSELGGSHGCPGRLWDRVL